MLKAIKPLHCSKNSDPRSLSNSMFKLEMQRGSVTLNELEMNHWSVLYDWWYHILQHFLWYGNLSWKIEKFENWQTGIFIDKKFIYIGDIIDVESFFEITAYIALTGEGSWSVFRIEVWQCCGLEVSQQILGVASIRS